MCVRFCLFCVHVILIVLYVCDFDCCVRARFCFWCECVILLVRAVRARFYLLMLCARDFSCTSRDFACDVRDFSCDVHARFRCAYTI